MSLDMLFKYAAAVAHTALCWIYIRYNMLSVHELLPRWNMCRGALFW